jgi:hypothetical protein
LKLAKTYKFNFFCLAGVLFVFSHTVTAQTETDSALWSGGLFLFERDSGLNYSVEYQLRLNEHMSSFSSHFLEFQGYKKTSRSILLYGAYRYTRRQDHDENRLVAGGFWDLTQTDKPVWEDPNRFKAVLQLGYQHDFDVEFDDRLMNSNSIRWILVGSKPATETITPFFLAGVLTTWNDAYSFGVDKIRLGGGFSWKLTRRSRLRSQYIYEIARFMTPKKHTHIIWLRYEVNLGK